MPKIDEHTPLTMTTRSQQKLTIAVARRMRRSSIVLALAAGVLSAGESWSASPPDQSIPSSLTLFVTGSTRYEDNVFRKAEGESTIAGRDELVTRMGGGLTFDLPISRQRLQANVRAEHADYSNYADLNHNPLAADASWNWAVGDWVWGAVEARYKYSISSFEELDEIIKDMQTERDVTASAVFELVPSIQLAVDGASGSTKKSVRTFLDRQESKIGGELRWMLSNVTYVGVRQSVATSNYLEPKVNPDGSLRNSDFTMTSSAFVWAWEGETKSRFRGAVGTTSKDFDAPEAQFPDFNGLTYDALLWWRTTARVTIEGVARRLLRTRDDASGDSVQTLARIRPIWEATERLSFNCSWSQEQDDFPKTPERQDDTIRLSVGGTYEPIEKLVLSLNAAHENRDSTIEDNKFVANLYSFGVEFEF